MFAGCFADVGIFQLAGVFNDGQSVVDAVCVLFDLFIETLKVLDKQSHKLKREKMENKIHIMHDVVSLPKEEIVGNIT